MKEFSYIITDKDGIHARPAGELVKIAKEFETNILIRANEKDGDCKRIFTVMALGVKKGQEVTLRFEGPDEDKAFEAVTGFMKEKL